MAFLPRMAVAVAAAAMFPVIAAAQPPAPQGPPAQGRRAMRPAPQARQLQTARPQLTEQQREQLRTFDEQQRAATETARRELADLHRQLDEALTAAGIDNAKVNQLRASIVQKETLLAQQRIDRRTKLASILTAEQRQAMRGRGLGRAPLRERLQLRQSPRGPARQLRGGRGIGGRGVGGRAAGRGALPRGRTDDARLRAEINRLEAQLEALRRRVR